MKSGLMIGDVLANRYRLDSILGEGGMGAVYEANQIDLNRAVAVKLMLAQGPDADESVSRFQREARVTAALHHPGAVKIFDFGKDEAGRFYIVMEKLHGTTLRSFVMPGGSLMPLGRAVSIAIQIADVLVAAHAIGLVHRDLKPENVFIERNHDGSDRVVVVDFGLAYIEDRADATRMTKEGVIAGTPMYMSPEQCQGRGISTPADVYALGCMLYEMACGFVPFEGAAFQLLVKHSFEDPIPPSQRREGHYVPRALEDLILEMLRKDPSTRPRPEEVEQRLAKIETTLGERERGRGRELLEGRVARMIPTVQPSPIEKIEFDVGMRPTAVPEPQKMLGIVGVIPDEMVLGLRANGLPPLALHGPPIPTNVIAVFAPDATDAVVADLVRYGMPILTDHAPDDLERATRMMGLGIADVVPKPVQVATLATKVQRAVKKAARRAR